MSHHTALEYYMHEMQLPKTFIDYCKSKIGKSTQHLLKEAMYKGTHKNEWKLVVPEGLFDITEQEDGELV